MLFLLAFVLLSQAEDVLYGVTTNFTSVPGTTRSVQSFDDSVTYMRQLLTFNVPYIGIYLYTDGEICENINSTLPVQMVVFGMDVQRNLFNEAISTCSVLGDCLNTACNWQIKYPYMVTSFCLTGMFLY